MLPDLSCDHALLLQGPAGPFFRRFGSELRQAGIEVTKVNFHGGDRLFYPGPRAVDYGGTPQEWPTFIAKLLEERTIDAMFVYGDERPYHKVAIEAARERDVAVWVFEEGYLRPDWITLERHGVNGNSRLPRDPERYLAALNGAPDDDGRGNGVLRTGPTWGRHAWYSGWSAYGYTYENEDFRHYRHHRELNMWKHTRWHVRGWFRKVWYGLRERSVLERLTGELSGRFFVVPLQQNGDFQFVHSPYDDVPEFVDAVARVFAQHASPTDHIVFKHHPMDRPYVEWGRLHRSIAKKHGLADRLIYVHDLHLPTMLDHARGTITINSTVGLQSIHHDTPVKCMGTAVYDLPGLTFQGELAEFLAAPGTVDQDLYRAFRAWLEKHNQANGSFYRRLPGHESGTGIRWFEAGEG